MDPLHSGDDLAKTFTVRHTSQQILRRLYRWFYEYPMYSAQFKFRIEYKRDVLGRPEVDQGDILEAQFLCAGTDCDVPFLDPQFHSIFLHIPQ